MFNTYQKLHLWDVWYSSIYGYTSIDNVLKGFRCFHQTNILLQPRGVPSVIFNAQADFNQPLQYAFASYASNTPSTASESYCRYLGRCVSATSCRSIPVQVQVPFIMTTAKILVTAGWEAFNRVPIAISFSSPALCLQTLTSAATLFAGHNANDDFKNTCYPHRTIGADIRSFSSWQFYFCKIPKLECFRTAC